MQKLVLKKYPSLWDYCMQKTVIPSSLITKNAEATCHPSKVCASQDHPMWSSRLLLLGISSGGRYLSGLSTLTSVRKGNRLHS